MTPMACARILKAGASSIVAAGAHALQPTSAAFLSALAGPAVEMEQPRTHECPYEMPAL